MTHRLEFWVPQVVDATLRVTDEMDANTSVVAEVLKLRLLWSMKSVIASLSGVARCNANNAEEENCTILVILINYWTLSIDINYPRISKFIEFNNQQTKS